MTKLDIARTATADTAADSIDSMLRRVAHAPAAPIDAHLADRFAGRLVAGSSLARGRFQVFRCIGQGGMGVVYEAFDKERNAPIALKTLVRLDPAGIYRLKNEFRAIADVPHENLVRLYELFADEAVWFFTMELIDGVPFDRWVRPEGALDEFRLRASLPQLASAVVAIHRAGKLHRDLKPSNALVRSDGRVAVLDFGLTVDPVAGSVGQTIEDFYISGTPAYMAPEQAAFEELGPASDWYALGVMLFEALTGRLPFEGGIRELMDAKRMRSAAAPRDFVADVPEDLNGLCSELLARNPALRPGAESVLARVGASPVSPPSERAAAISSTPPAAFALTGREQELATLHQAWAAAQSETRPVVMFVSGESGIGKSALVTHFLSELAAGPSMVLAGRCYERESVPYKAFDGLIDELSRRLRRAAPEQAASLMPRDVSALRKLFPVLGRIAAIAEAPERSTPDPRELRLLGFRALGELLGRIRDRQPLVLSIDDLQWADEDSITLLLHVLRRADAPHMLLILTHRSGPLESKPILKPMYEALPADLRLDVRSLEVGPLSAEACREIVRAQAGSEPAALEPLASEAAGNPFLLRELLLSAAGCSQARAAGTSLAQLLQQRIEALTAPQRDLLEVVAVAARPLEIDVAAAAIRLDAVRPVLEALRAAQLISTSGDPRSVECYHDKIREAVVGALPPARARALHHSLADVLEARVDVDLEHLCAHCEAAGEPERAALHADRAALRAVDALAFERAVLFYDKALASTHWHAKRRRQILWERADVLAQAGRGTAAAAAYLDMIAGASAAEVIELKRKAGEQFVYSGHLARGHALLEESLRPLGIGVPRTTAAAIASVFYQRARLRLRGRELSENRQVDPAVARKLAALRGAGGALIRTDGVRGTDLLLRYLRLALDAGDPVEACRGLAWEVVGSAFLGLSSKRIHSIARHCEALCDQTNDGEGRGMLHFGLGWARFGEPASVEEFDRSIRLFREQPRSDAYYNRAQAEMLCAVQRTFHGELEEVARELPAHIDEAWSRGDLCIVPMWSGAFASIARLAASDEAGVTHDLERARAAWPADAFTFQDFSLFQGQTLLLRYRRDGRAAWADAQRNWERYLRSPMEKLPYFAHWVCAHYGEAALLWASQTRSKSERAALLETAARMAAGLPARGRLSLPLRAALAYQRGQRESALALLAVAAGKMPRLWAQAARFRLGKMLGGEAGVVHVDEAGAFFRERGVADPEQLVAALFPALEDV